MSIGHVSSTSPFPLPSVRNNEEYKASENYVQDISHYAGSSSEKAACSVEPGIVEDVGQIVC